MHNSFSIRRIGRYASCTQETNRNTKSQILHCAICELHWIMFWAGSCYSSHLERYHRVIPLWHEFDHHSCQKQPKQRTANGRSLPQLSRLQAIDRQTATGFRAGLVEISNHAMVHVLSGRHPKLCKVSGISPHLAVLVVSVLLLLLTQKLGWDSIQRVWAQFLLLQGRMQKNNLCEAALEDLTCPSGSLPAYQSWFARQCWSQLSHGHWSYWSVCGLKFWGNKEWKLPAVLLRVLWHRATWASSISHCANVRVCKTLRWCLWPLLGPPNRA